MTVEKKKISKRKLEEEVKMPGMEKWRTRGKSAIWHSCEKSMVMTIEEVGNRYLVQ